jgi:excisionase family DNA binding protein
VATILSVPRPTVLRLINEGKLGCRWVGGHRRIPARSVVAFQDAEAAARAEAGQSLARLSNELGLMG